MLFEAGHGSLPHNQLVRATLDWYDKYLGPTHPSHADCAIEAADLIGLRRIAAPVIQGAWNPAAR